MPLFISEYLDILPATVAQKVVRLEAERDRAANSLNAADKALAAAMVGKATNPTPGNLAALAHAEVAHDEAAAALAGFDFIPRAVVAFDQGGFYHRHVVHGIRPAHVLPVLEPVRDHAAAVLSIRARLADLGARTAALDLAVSEGRLTQIGRDLHATDIALARLALEREEEQRICEAADAGVSINRRADLNPAAFLEIETA